MFSQAGYATAAIGKWHLGLGSESGAQDWNGEIDITPADLGFGTHYIMAATADRTPCVFIENGRIADFDPSAPVEVSYRGPFEDVPDYHRTPVTELKLRSSNGHDNAVVNGIGRIGYMKGGGKALWKDENIADSITAHAVEFILEHSDGPFFLYFATNDVHVPRMPHERFRGKSPMGLRGEAILQFDYSVGQILDALGQAGIRDNTIIILTSDNGPVLDDGYADSAAELVGDHSITGGLRGSKYSAFEGGTRIPAVISWPGRITQPSVSGALISQIDLFRSLASIIGAELPEDAAPDSQDLSEVLLGADTTGRDWIVEWSYTLSVRTREWKYIAPNDYPKSLSWCPGIETGTDPAPQLYRLPDEHTNVAPQHPDTVAELQKLLEETGLSPPSWSNTGRWYGAWPCGCSATRTRRRMRYRRHSSGLGRPSRASTDATAPPPGSGPSPPACAATSCGSAPHTGGSRRMQPGPMLRSGRLTRKAEASAEASPGNSRPGSCG